MSKFTKRGSRNIIPEILYFIILGQNVLFVSFLSLVDVRNMFLCCFATYPVFAYLTIPLNMSY